MARITVEDCLDQVNNRFELVMLAAKRARNLAMHGAEAQVPWENDKPTVVALREIAEGYIEKEEVPLTPDELLAMSMTLAAEEEATPMSTSVTFSPSAPSAAETAPEEGEMPPASPGVSTSDSDEG